MSPSAPPTALGLQLRAMLEPARRHLRSWAIQDALQRAVIIVLWAVAAAAAVEFIAFLVCSRLPMAVPLPLHGFVVALTATAILAGTIVVVQALSREAPTFAEVAARVDMACNTHNIFTTAVSLAERAEPSVFSLAAIRQATQQAELAARTTPVFPTPSCWSRRTLAGGWALVVACGVGLLWFCLPGEAMPPDLRASLAVTDRAAVVPAADTSPAHDRGPRPAEPRFERPEPSKTMQGQHAAQRANSIERPVARPSGTPGTTSSTHVAQQSQTGSGAGSEHPSQAAGSGSSRKPTPARARETQSQSSGKGTGSSAGRLSGGGSGAGRAIPVKADGSQRETPQGADVDSTEDDAQPDELSDGNQQRGGVQPSLPDRTEAPSRELGITGPQTGRPGTGRGGPSPAKKSRGAASLLMGVPVPDFVKGRAGPGATAVTTEKSSPLTAPGQANPAALARTRTAPESLVPRYEIPWTDAQIAADYSRRWQQRTTTQPGETLMNGAGKP